MSNAFECLSNNSGNITINLGFLESAYFFNILLHYIAGWSSRKLTRVIALRSRVRFPPLQQESERVNDWTRERVDE